MTTRTCRHSPFLSREGNMWYPSTFLYSNKVESTIHRLRRSPFLSRKEHRFSCFPLISFRMLALCKKRTFCFIPVICKDCTILSREWHNHSCGLMICFKDEYESNVQQHAFLYPNIQRWAFGSWSVRARGSQVGTSWTDVGRCLNFNMAGRCASCRGTGGGFCE